jgi:gliding motility-associated lipoprotein GldH
MKAKNKLFFLGLAIMVVMVGCNINSLYEGAVDITNGKWDKSQIAKFDFAVKDTINGYDIRINIRNTNEYSFSNLYMFLTTITPSGKLKRDTLEMTLADDKGKWLGTGLGGIWASETLYQKNIRFPQSGTYRIEITQAMRNDVLEGIRDVSLRVEKTK